MDAARLSGHNPRPWRCASTSTSSAPTPTWPRCAWTLAARYGAKVTWVPILLGGLFRSHKSPDVPAAAMSPPRARLNLQDILRSADRAGVKLRMPADHPRRTVAAMRLILSAPVERQKAVAQDPSRPTGCAARMCAAPRCWRRWPRAMAWTWRPSRRRR
ncbi:MAG: DsbA family protein [bacterium]